jgi:hypothetical protein
MSPLQEWQEKEVTMKRYLMIFLVIGFLQILAAQVVIKQITATNDNPIVSRVTITLSEKTEWSYTVETNKHAAIVSIKNCSDDNPTIRGMSNNKVLAGISLDGNAAYRKVNLTLNGPFLIEKSSAENPFRIIIDLFAFKRNYTFDERLAQAKFYEQTGQLTTASKEYSKTMQAFPQNTDGYYGWANVLIKRDRPETAKAKLRLVAKDSGSYSAAQSLLAKLEGKAPLETVPESPDQPVSNTTPQVAEQPPAESIRIVSQPHTGTPIEVNPEEIKIRFFSFQTFFGKSWKEFCQTPIMLKLRSLPIWFWIIVIIILALLILILLDYLLNHKRRGKTAKVKKSNLLAGDAIKQGMVIKLLENGWDVKEIARELMLSLSETQLYVKQGKRIIKRKKQRSE